MEDFVDPGVVVANAEIAGLDCERFAHGEERIEHELLRHDAQRAARIAVVGDDVVAQHPRRAGVGAGQPREDRDQRRLARAVRSQQAEELALLDGEAHAGQRLHAAEAAGDVVDFDGERHDRRSIAADQTADVRRTAAE